MDLSKLNIEFSNMQNIITKYNTMVNCIKCEIKKNDKDISKYEVKIKNNKNVIERDICSLMLDICKNQNIFLNQLIGSEKQKNEENI